jgi:hypothetical protein
MAWKAIRVVCGEEDQNRLTVVPGTVSRPELNGDSPGDVAALLALRFRTSQVESIDLYRVESGALLQGGANGGGCEVVGAHVLQRAFEGTSDRRTGSGDNNGLRHTVAFRDGWPLAAERGRTGRLRARGRKVAAGC